MSPSNTAGRTTASSQHPACRPRFRALPNVVASAGVTSRISKFAGPSRRSVGRPADRIMKRWVAHQRQPGVGEIRQRPHAEQQPLALGREEDIRGVDDLVQLVGRHGTAQHHGVVEHHGRTRRRTTPAASPHVDSTVDPLDDGPVPGEVGQYPLRSAESSSGTSCSQPVIMVSSVEDADQHVLGVRGHIRASQPLSGTACGRQESPWMTS